MTITLELSPETEAKARRLASSNGLSVEETVRQMVEGLPSPKSTPVETDASDDVDEKSVLLWDRVQSVLQKSWESQPEGAVRRTSEIEAPCAFRKDAEDC